MKYAHLNIIFLAAIDTNAEALARLRIDAMRERLEKIGRFDLVRAREQFLSTFEPQHIQ